MTKPDTTSNWALQGPSISAIRDERYDYRVGHIITKHGVVGLYDQTADMPLTRLDLVINGRRRSATWSRTFSDRYLQTLATRWAASLAADDTTGPRDGGEDHE